MELTHFSQEMKIYKYGLQRRTPQKVYSVQTPVLWQASFFFLNRKTLIFSRCVVSEALYHTSSAQIHPRTTHAHAHSSCQSRVQPHRLLLSTRSGYLPLCTVSYSNKHQQHSDPDTFLSRTHPHTNTLGDNALQWGLQWPKAAKHL